MIPSSPDETQSRPYTVFQVKDAQLQARVQALPKIELHRHLEGSLRLQSLVDIAREHPIDVPGVSIEALRPLVQMMPDEARTFQNFLAKFHTLRQFYVSPRVIERLTHEVVEDAALDNVRYLELRFTPRALCNVIDCQVSYIIPLVCDAVQAAAQLYGIQVNLIVSMNRHESVELGEEILKAALANRDRGVVGLDLAGDEANFSAMPFRSIFLRARAEGLFTTVHAGEWSGAASVWDAIGNLHAHRVGHGIKVLEDPAMVHVVAEREIVLEVCPVSNVLSGVVPQLEEHPLTVLTNQGVHTTINTDDPLISNTTLSDEIALAMEHMNISLEEIKAYTLRAARAAFLPSTARDALVRQFQTWFAEA